MKRVLHISKYYYPFIGGVEQTAKDCVNSLKGLVQQEVICFDHRPKSHDSIDEVEGVKVIRVGQQVLISSQALGKTYGKNLKNEIATFKPDIIIFHYPNPFVAHYLLKYLPETTKLIIYWHLDIIKQKILRNFFYGQNKKLIYRADKIVATSPNYIDGSYWLSQVKDKCVVIPSCINEDRLKSNDKIDEKAKEIRQQNKNKIICLSVGRHVPYKGFEYLIKASKLVDDRFVFYITGKGPLTEELHQLASGDEKIHFLGLIDDDQLIAYLKVCDIFCFPSITKNEAFGLALAEGMYFRHPAITFTIPGSGVNYVNKNGITGIEVPNEDVNAYAEALVKLGNNEQLKKQYGDAARERVINNYLYTQYEKNIQDLIASL